MSINVDWVNTKIQEIWEDHSQFLAENRPNGESPWPRWPALYDELIENPDVLYVGLNPSFYKDQMKQRLQEYMEPLELDDLRWTGHDEDVHDFLKWERKYAKESYSYFTPMRNFGIDHDLMWEHIDIFVTRVTSQNKLDDSIGVEAYTEGKHQHAFLKRQLDLFFSLLNELAPDVVVVENALARDFLKGTRLKNTTYDLTPEENVDPESGYQTIELKDETPIFFSGMLSGRRALDIGSRQRLHWHVAKAHNNIQGGIDQ